MSDEGTPLFLGPPPPIHIPPPGPVAGASPPAPVAFSENPPAPPPPVAEPPAAKPPPAAPTPPPAPKPAPSGATTYTVKSGDTLGQIAERHGTTVSAIMQANPGITNPDRISVGQRLQIPGKAPGGGGTQPSRPPATSPDPQKPNPQPQPQPGNGLIFPLWIRPTASWKDGPRYFGAGRSGGRLHGASDLYAPFGTKIRAIADGEVIQAPYYFYDGTNALEVWHPGVGVVRYGEISIVKSVPMRAGQKVKAGEHIAYVGLLESLNMAMLHFELFGEQARGQSLSGGGPYRRNRHLKDPTPLIDKLYKQTFG